MEHCTTCDTHYPAREGACRWCGTKPEVFRIAPYAWKGAGVLACIGLGWGAWAASRGTTETAIAESSVNESLTTVVDSGIAARRRARVVAVADTALDSLLAAVATIDSSPPADSSTDSVSAQPSPGVQQPAPSVSEPVAAAPVPAPVAIDSTPIHRAPTAAARVPSSSRLTTIRPSRTARWMRATVRNWVIVRAAASRSSRVVASIGPDTRVQLGEARGDWMRIRMKGITGWVERSRF
ncbi:MAG TPA: SH3 domain-containing protein [Gemmatimonadaceae bacterium]|nr:SH3 domain-containing protein [Gemmatimonadaceae bacterium]